MAHTLHHEGLPPDDGIYPDKRGEFCGNHMPGSEAVPMKGQTLGEARRWYAVWLALMYYGKPATDPRKTSEEMAALGYVGLYLRADQKLEPWQTPVETDELTEEHVIKRPPPEIPKAAAVSTHLDMLIVDGIMGTPEMPRYINEYKEPDLAQLIGENVKSWNSTDQ